MDSIQWMSPGCLLGIRHCVRLPGHVVSQAPSGGGGCKHTHTADSLCRRVQRAGEGMETAQTPSSKGLAQPDLRNAQPSFTLQRAQAT